MWNRSGTKTVVALCAMALALVLIRGARGAREPSTHRDSLPVRITYNDGSTRQSVLIAQSPFAKADPSPEMKFRTSTGEVLVWMDQLVSITDIQDNKDADKADAQFTFKRGQPRRLNFGRFTEDIVIQNDDDTREVVDLRKIQSLEMLRRPAASQPSSRP